MPGFRSNIKLLNDSKLIIYCRKHFAYLLVHSEKFELNIVIHSFVHYSSVGICISSCILCSKSKWLKDWFWIEEMYNELYTPMGYTNIYTTTSDLTSSI